MALGLLVKPVLPGLRRPLREAAVTGPVRSPFGQEAGPESHRGVTVVVARDPAPIGIPRLPPEPGSPAIVESQGKPDRVRDPQHHVPSGGSSPVHRRAGAGRVPIAILFVAAALLPAPWGVAAAPPRVTTGAKSGTSIADLSLEQLANVEVTSV